MAAVAIYSARSSTLATATSKFGNVGIGDKSIGTNATPIADTLATAAIAGTYSKMAIRTTTNAATGTSTASFYKNGSNANQTISIPAGAPGSNAEFSDLVNTDSVVLNDVVSQTIISGNGGSIVLTSWGVTYDASVNTSYWVGSFNRVAAGTKTYYRLVSNTASSTTEAASFQIQMPTAGTLKNAIIGLPGNPAKDSTFGWRLNGLTGGADTALLVFAAAGSGSGQHIDNGASDTIALNDLLDGYGVGVGGTGAVGLVLATFETTDASMVCIAQAINGDATYTTSLTKYEPINGRIAIGTTEVDWQSNAFVPCTASRYSVYVVSDTITATSTINFRKNSGNANGSISIPASSGAGWYSDLLSNDTFVINDELAWQVITGSTGTSLIIASLVLKMSMSMPGAAGHMNMLMGVG